MDPANPNPNPNPQTRPLRRQSTPQPPTLGKTDGDETDTDCGGGKCPRCADDSACVAGTDCVSEVCVDLVCATTMAPSAIPTPGPTYTAPVLKGLWVDGDRNQTQAEVSPSGKVTFRSSWTGQDPLTSFAWSVVTVGGDDPHSLTLEHGVTTYTSLANEYVGRRGRAEGRLEGTVPASPSPTSDATCT